jgi:uncharacterized protein (DUF608 family)
MGETRWGRRDFMRLGAQGASALSLGQAADVLGFQQAQSDTTPPSVAMSNVAQSFNGNYEGERLAQVAFPIGGMGAGMICLEGAGGVARFSLRHRPELEREHGVFAAVSIKGPQPLARVLEGPVPRWKLRPQFPGPDGTGCWGLPRFHHALFEAQFPFATVRFKDEEVPLELTLTGWSPFSPGDADNASLPVAGLEYTFTNRTTASVEAVFSFNAENFLAEPLAYPPPPDSERLDRIRPTPGGFILYGPGAKGRPTDEGTCAIWVNEPNVTVNHAWFLDSLDLLWRDFQSGNYHAREALLNGPAAGASLFAPFALAPGEAKTVTVYLAWYVPNSNVYEPETGSKDGKPISYPHPAESYRPWYAGRFSEIGDVIHYWQVQYSPLRQAAERFSRTFYDSTLPPELLEAVSANLSILKSPTVLRQPDGRLWGWEGSWAAGEDRTGISGTTTHVWNYAQAIPHLFPDLERSLRETEFGGNQNEEGLQYCRTPLPIRPVEPGHTFPDGAAADGQLGGIIKVYRDWRISGDTQWLRRLWPRIRASLDYCIRTWDPEHRGWIEEPHLTTYDVLFWGADSVCTSLYLGALKAATLMGQALKEPVDLYAQLLRRAELKMETQLFNGEYFQQEVKWRDLRAPFPPKDEPWFPNTPAWSEFQKKEGPQAQCGAGCLSDGLLGAWLSLISGLGDVLDARKVESHLTSVYRHNLKRDLTNHTNFARAAFACGAEPGLLACTWPRGGRPSVAVPYADEVWTGTEYQVASHLIALGRINEGLEIVRACRRRYDGRVRNPFDEVEAGHWYARAMSSYALLQAFSGARYDAVDQILYLTPVIRGDYRNFLATATGYGTVGVKDGKPFLEVVSGEIKFKRIQYTAAP